MNESIQIIEGTWEEVAAHEAELRGHQVKLLVIGNGEAQPVKPDPVELPRGSYLRITNGLCQHPLADEKLDLWEIIAEERTVWRQMAREKSE